MSANDQNSPDTLSLFRELAYFGLNVNLAHGQFNNCLPSHLPAQKYLEKLSSIYDLNLFRLNALEDPNPVSIIIVFIVDTIPHIVSTNLKVNFPVVSVIRASLFYIIISGALSETFQVHLLDELNFEFSIIGVSETKIISGKEMDFNPRIPGYVFEYVPTPLASGGVGLYINDSLKYTVIEKVCDEAFQSLSKSNFHRKATSFVISYIDNITLPNSPAAKTGPSFDVLF